MSAAAADAAVVESPKSRKCRKCSSEEIDVEEWSDLMKPVPFYDNEKREHVHDDNSKGAKYKCRNCGLIWVTKRTHSCWCGWKQEQDHLGYQGPKYVMKCYQIVNGEGVVLDEYTRAIDKCTGLSLDVPGTRDAEESADWIARKVASDAWLAASIAKKTD